MEPYLPLISIVTIVFNGERHILNSINTVKKQEYPNFEHIIIDGNSNDNTLEILKANLHDRIQYISEPDKGISDAFNKGIAKAKGSIVAILNVDDLYDKDTLQKLVNFYIQNDCKSGVYYSDITYFDSKHSYSLKANIKNIWKYMSLYHPSCFVTRDIYEQFGGFDLQYKFAMDCELIHRFIYNKVPFFYTPGLNVNFRLDGLSDKNYKQSLNEFYKSSKKYNYSLPLEFYYRYFLLKKLMLKGRIGQFLQPYYRKIAH